MKNSMKGVIAIIFTLALVISTPVVSYGATNPIPSPRDQMESGISSADVVCKAGLKLIIRAATDTAACVKSGSYDKMLQIGWAKTLAKLLEAKPQLSNIGDVKTVRIVPLFKDEGIQQTQPNIVLTHNYVFEACAKNKSIRAPEVLITSDSETKNVILSNPIPPNSCQIGTTIMKAADTNSIKASLVKKTDISIIVGELETKVTNLKEQLAIEKKLLSELIAQNPPPSDLNKKVSEKTDKIQKLRAELDVARADYQKNQYALMVGTKPPPVIQSELSNKEIPPTKSLPKDYSHVNKIKVVPQFLDSGRLKSDPITSGFNFVFEACAGKNSILFPELMIRSDSEIKSVKLSEPLDAFSCQNSSTTIKAADPNSINGTMITSGDISMMIQELENKVASLQESIAKNKKALTEIAKQDPPPEDLKQKVSELTNTITNQRDELNQAKQELISLKYMRSE